MGTSLFRLPLQHSDMFVRSIDFNNQIIKYRIYDKEKGTPMEPERESKFTISESQIDFDNVRFINYDLARFIEEKLNAA